MYSYKNNGLVDFMNIHMDKQNIIVVLHL